MKRLFILASFILSLNYSLFGQQIEWVTTDRDDYLIEHPKDWVFEESGFSGTTFIIMSPVDSETDQFNENINLLIQDLSGYDLDLDAFVELSTDQILTLMNDSEIVESTRVTSTPYNYHKVIYSTTQGELYVKFIQHYWVIDDEALVLTFTSEKDQFDNYAPVAEKIMNSFQVKE